MLEARLESELKLIADAGLTRKIMDLDFITPVKAIGETGKAFQVFSSNNYLGLSHAPEIIIAAQQAAAKSGTTSDRKSVV